MIKVHLEIDGVSACGTGSSISEDVRQVTCQNHPCKFWMRPRSVPWTQIGPYEWFSFVLGDPEWYPTTDERLVNYNDSQLNLIGLTEAHLTEDGHPCGGGAYWIASKTDPDPTLWTLVSLNPLHIEPSLLHNRVSGGCGHHGFIRNGAWEDVGRQPKTEAGEN